MNDSCDAMMCDNHCVVRRCSSMTSCCVVVLDAFPPSSGCGCTLRR